MKDGLICFRSLFLLMVSIALLSSLVACTSSQQEAATTATARDATTTPWARSSILTTLDVVNGSDSGQLLTVEQSPLIPPVAAFAALSAGSILLLWMMFAVKSNIDSQIVGEVRRSNGNVRIAHSSIGIRHYIMYAIMHTAIALHRLTGQVTVVRAAHSAIRWLGRR